MFPRSGVGQTTFAHHRSLPKTLCNSLASTGAALSTPRCSSDGPLGNWFFGNVAISERASFLFAARASKLGAPLTVQHISAQR
jgi:hypothetical protein